jgi:hypothetical protein
MEKGEEFEDKSCEQTPSRLSLMTLRTLSDFYFQKSPPNLDTELKSLKKTHHQQKEAYEGRHPNSQSIQLFHLLLTLISFFLKMTALRFGLLIF